MFTANRNSVRFGFVLFVTFAVNQLPHSAFAEELTTFLSRFPTERCDTTRRHTFDDWNQLFSEEEDLFGACVDAGLSIIVDDLSARSLGGMRLTSSNEIRVRPKMNDYGLDLDQIGSTSGSRMLIDAFCRRNLQLFDTVYLPKGCPVQGVFSPSEGDLLEMTFNFGIGTNYNVSMTTNPLVVGPGLAERLDKAQYGGFSESLHFFKSLEIVGVTAGALDLDTSIVLGDLKVSESVFDWVDFSDLVVLGSLTISVNAVDRLRMERVWVAGDVIIKGSELGSLQIWGLRSLGDLTVDGNSFVATDAYSPILFELIDIQGGVSVGRPAHFPNAELEARYVEFLESLEGQVEYMREKRVEGSE